MSTPVCFLNGRYLDAREATISVLDRGFLFGEGLFETWRSYRGRPFAVAEHLARLTRSARALGIPFDANEPWERRTRTLLTRNGLTDGGAAVRLTITRGPGPPVLIATTAHKPTRLMLARPLEPGLAQLREEGVAVHLAKPAKMAHGALEGLKTLNYLPAVVGKTDARARGCFESVYRTDDGRVLEGTTSNLFVYDGSTLATTALDEGVLPGITRDMVLRLARKLVPVVERRLTTDDLAAAKEIFLTASTIEVLPVTRVGRRRVSRGRVGPITRELQQRYRTLVSERVGLPVERLGE